MHRFSAAKIDDLQVDNLAELEVQYKGFYQLLVVSEFIVLHHGARDAVGELKHQIQRDMDISAARQRALKVQLNGDEPVPSSKAVRSLDELDNEHMLLIVREAEAAINKQGARQAAERAASPSASDVSANTARDGVSMDRAVELANLRIFCNARGRPVAVHRPYTNSRVLHRHQDPHHQHSWASTPALASEYTTFADTPHTPAPTVTSLRELRPRRDAYWLNFSPTHPGTLLLTQRGEKAAMKDLIRVALSAAKALTSPPPDPPGVPTPSTVGQDESQTSGPLRSRRASRARAGLDGTGGAATTQLIGGRESAYRNPLPSLLFMLGHEGLPPRFRQLRYIPLRVAIRWRDPVRAQLPAHLRESAPHTSTFLPSAGSSSLRGVEDRGSRAMLSSAAAHMVVQTQCELPISIHDAYGAPPTQSTVQCTLPRAALLHVLRSKGGEAVRWDPDTALARIEAEDMPSDAASASLLIRITCDVTLQGRPQLDCKVSTNATSSMANSCLIPTQASWRSSNQRILVS